MGVSTKKIYFDPRKPTFLVKPRNKKRKKRKKKPSAKLYLP